MDSSLLSFGAVILGIGVFVAFIYFAIQYEKKLRAKVEAQYQLFADTFSLAVVPGNKAFLNATYPQISGKIDDINVLIYSYRTGGKNKTTYTVVQVMLPANVPNFKILKQGFIQAIAKKFGGQDIQIGNPPVDEAFVFKCEDEASLIKIVDKDIQQLLLAMKDKIQQGIYTDKGIMTYSFLNHMHTDIKRDEIEKIFVLMLKLAKNVRNI